MLIELTRNASGYHNGGSLEFGPRGFLHVAIGEATRLVNSQTISHSLFGGILRIDVAGVDPAAHPPPRQPEAGRTRGYRIPSDNPFVGEPGVLEEFLALGLRNPFRMSIDPVTGEIWVGDVGSDYYEEINRILPGGNYGFPFAEGPLRFDQPPSAMAGKLSTPVFAYPHNAYERAVIGGGIVRGGRFEELAGRYVFADNYSGNLFAIDPDSADPQAVRLAQAPEVAQRGISSVVPMPDGEIWITVLGDDDRSTGRVLKLVRKPDAGELEVAAGRADAPLERCADVRALFLENCSRCHGRDGRGPVEEARFPSRSLPPDFTDPSWQERQSVERVRRVIAGGGIAAGLSADMPPWAEILAVGEIDALAQHLTAASGCMLTTPLADGQEAS